MASTETTQPEISSQPQQDLETRLSFLQFSPKDEANLKDLSGILAPHISDLVAEFYQHLQKFEETASLLTDELITERLLTAQRAYLERLTQGNYDSQYAAERLKIGQVHNRIGLLPRWYISAYNLYIHLLYPLVFQAYCDDPEQIQNTILSLTKVLMLDIQLAIEAYIDSFSKQLQDANRRLEEYNLNLQAMVRQRTEELESFVYTVSHDLKAPLVTIQGFATAMEEDYAAQFDATAIEYLNYIQRSALKMGDLIQDLLELSRIGRIESPHEAVEMQQIVQEALTQIQLQIEAAHVDVEIQAALPTVQCGKSRLVQVFVNLLTNAVKYMGENPSPRIQIGWQDQGDFYEFFVADNGIGIEPQYHEKIFELFQTLRELEGVEGTGVGLAIVKRIIAYHKGTVWVTSEKGKGSTFHFTLPKMGMFQK